MRKVKEVLRLRFELGFGQRLTGSWAQTTVAAAIEIQQ
jgi:hypothetical protein